MIHVGGHHVVVVGLSLFRKPFYSPHLRSLSFTTTPATLMIQDKYIGLILAMSSSLFIGLSFIITKKGLMNAQRRHGNRFKQKTSRWHGTHARMQVFLRLMASITIFEIGRGGPAWERVSFTIKATCVVVDFSV